MVLRNVVPRQGTETRFPNEGVGGWQIEKCSSPTGDGNHLIRNIQSVKVRLRNVVPRQGTETCDFNSVCHNIRLSY